ncbi:DUF2726 domain-containing protein [Vibrio parahaemolyticus]|uniref:DUF2726 domain-containing protein n=1 Tax=Vibrio parahaemolyticus TaxID=670 RepID=UPI002360BF70|nr:DUF2726 domain-containing protein [Vibrio parahaemolyticus]EGR0760465.1 DUF2726 domain-containing protein [Vibrio parahaemolyticus]EJG0413279.1 DUF2726 domain-containing protein [Vibrio parahaemolyticus]ELI5392412.1 DUF2726 domain-containing protein [Vibrio parahaemolyticus]
MIELIIVLAVFCIVYLFTKGRSKKKHHKVEAFVGTRSNDISSQNDKKKKAFVPHKKHNTLCSKSETIFYKALLDILPSEYIVHCQVSMMALVQPVNFKDNSKTWAKRVDFVITDRDTKVIAVIELDDSSHRQKKRQERDLYVNAAFAGHHKLLRFEAMGNYDPISIASVIEREIGLKCNISKPVPQCVVEHI